ncbi:MAG: hypothetical protein EAX86_01480 [Candidatus Heimdallarchaeota archaeon]|nr:hypothetical protein [Candidatus Heimdallarchaeota archaeon]
MNLRFRPERMKIAKITLQKDQSREFLKKVGEKFELEFIDLVKTAKIEPTAPTELENRINKVHYEYAQLIQLLKELNYYPRDKSVSLEKSTLEEFIKDALNLLSRTKDLSQDLERLKVNREQFIYFEGLLGALDKIKALNLQNIQDIGEGTHFYATVGFLKIIHVYRLEMALDQLTAGNYLFETIGDEKLQSLCLIGVDKGFKGALNRLLSTLNFEEVIFPEKLKGSPSEAFEQLSRDKLHLNEEIDKLKSNIQSSIDENIVQLFAMEEQLGIELKRIDLIRKSQLRNNLLTFWAWLPKNQEKQFEREIRKIDSSLQLKIHSPDLESGEFPTKISNNIYSRSFEGLVHGFGTPGYNEWDPTKFLSIFIPIFFGIMFGDFIDGLVVFLIGLYGLKLNPKKYSKNSMLAELQTYFDRGGPVLVTIGISAMIFGILFGSYRGLGGSHAHEAGLDPLWFSPEAEGGQFALLELAIVLGAITIGIALIFQFIQVWSHNKSEAIFLPGMFFIFYLCLILLLFSFGPDPMKWISETTGQVDLLALQIKTAESWIGHLLGLDWVRNVGIPVFGIFGFSYPMFFLIVSLIMTTGYHFRLGMDGMSEWLDYLITMISNTISFARIFAYNIVHGSLSLVFIQLFAGSITPGMTSFEVLLAYIPGMIIGAPIVIGLELLVSFLQSLRLCWVEFFGKLHYVGSGFKFNPFHELRMFSR